MAGFDHAKREAGYVSLFRTDRKPFWSFSLLRSRLASLQERRFPMDHFRGEVSCSELGPVIAGGGFNSLPFMRPLLLDGRVLLDGNGKSTPLTALNSRCLLWPWLCWQQQYCQYDARQNEQTADKKTQPKPQRGAVHPKRCPA